MSQNEILSIGWIFDRFEGPAAMARALGIKTSAASEMKRRQSIPVRYWPKLLSAAYDRGLVLDEAILVSIHITKPAA